MNFGRNRLTSGIYTMSAATIIFLQISSASFLSMENLKYRYQGADLIIEAANNAYFRPSDVESLIV